MLSMGKYDDVRVHGMVMKGKRNVKTSTVR
jgi:hypothetical protein